ncbi:MAG: sulfur carrier protein ThiS [Burkholderiaceae bacterium]|jgi:sulfur carrier protein|nr:sulfur carrier protein ThiS [Burkholderiaceae bacterium]
MAIEIELNGETRQIATGHTLQNLVDTMQLAGQALAIAVNRQVVSRQKWGERSLTQGDRVEIVRAIGGG